MNEANQVISSDYAGGFNVGDICTYSGCLAIDGKVQVIEWVPHKWKNEGCVGDFRFRRGLVPVYSALFPETRYWWVHPCQLTNHGEGNE